MSYFQMAFKRKNKEKTTQNKNQHHNEMVNYI